MTPFEGLCESLRASYPALDDNVLAALLVAVVGSRHIVIRSKHPGKTRSVLHRFAQQVVAPGDCTSFACHSDVTWDHLTSQLVKTGRVQRLCIIESPDKASDYVQALLVTMLYKQMLVVGRQTYKLPAEFVLIIVTADGHALNSHLRDCMLLQHVADMSSRGNTEETSTLSVAKQMASQQDADNEEILEQLVQTQDETKGSIRDTADLHSDPRNGTSSLSSMAAPAESAKLSRFVETMAPEISSVVIVAQIKRYMQDIVVYLRTHRLVRSGVSPRAVKDFDFLVRALCVLHNSGYATPSIVAIAARKQFPLRIKLCQPRDEPSLNYGGDIDTVTQWMAKWDEELVIEDVLNSVPVPL